MPTTMQALLEDVLNEPSRGAICAASIYSAFKSFHVPGSDEGYPAAFGGRGAGINDVLAISHLPLTRTSVFR